MITCLTGGVGGAKLALGLSRLIPADRLTFIANTGDDFELLGLRISPDVDTLIYTLAGKVNPETGWGLAGDTFRCLGAVEARGLRMWFRLGDLDLGTHLWRSQLLRQGQPLGLIVSALAHSFGVENRILPATEAYAPTYVRTGRDRLHLQEYFVRERCLPKVDAIEYRGADQSRPAPGVLEAIDQCRILVFAPSNPLISIDPILAIPGVRQAVQARKGRAVAISPIVAGKAIKGPAAKMLQELGLGASADAVARHYRGLIDVFVIDQQDRELAPGIEQLGVSVIVTDTIMTSLADRVRLAKLITEI
ncbi:MAG: 2-phospho-L-lactate transferase [Acidobacteriota bacterium]